MSDYEFTDAEKKLIYLYTHKRMSLREKLSYYAIYVLPSLLFAGFSVWRHDFMAAITAYIALFIMAMFYLGRSLEYSEVMASLCKKAEAMSQAIKRELQ